MCYLLSLLYYGLQDKILMGSWKKWSLLTNDQKKKYLGGLFPPTYLKLLNITLTEWNSQLFHIDWMELTTLSHWLNGTHNSITLTEWNSQLNRHLIDTVYITRCKSNKHKISAMTAFELGELLLFGGGDQFSWQRSCEYSEKFYFCIWVYEYTL
jgi:hypothetical protein